MQNLRITVKSPSIFRACLLWNGLPQPVKHSESILELKRKLKELENVDCSCILCR